MRKPIPTIFAALSSLTSKCEEKNRKVERIDIGNGYVDEHGEVRFYLRDMQGNNRVTITHSGEALELKTYYPYGIPFTDLAGNDRYLYCDKELDRMNGLDLYDSQARWYDPALVGTTTMDPLAERYYHLSPYSWCAGNPINFIDPNGNVVIFINGMHLNSGGKSEYWNGVDETIKEQLNDNSARYYDGSCGGALNTATKEMFSSNLNPMVRMGYGFFKGKNDAKEIYDNLGETETIKIASHSMGAAYAKGFVLGLQSYAKENGLDHRIKLELDLAPFQSMFQTANSDVETTMTISHWWDGVAGPSFMIGADNIRTRSDNFNLLPTKEHSIDSFNDEIPRFVPKGNIINGGPIKLWEEKGNK